MVRRSPSLAFGKVFMTIFRRNVASVTPFPDEAREEAKKRKAEFLAQAAGGGAAADNKEAKKKVRYYSGGTSMSFPTSMRDDSVDLEKIEQEIPKPKVDIKKVYRDILQPRLSEGERKVMERALGVGGSGIMNACEIAREIGVSRATVRIHEKRALQKAEAAGKVKIKQRLSLFGSAES